MEVAKRYGFDLWQMDWVWWDIEYNMNNEASKYWLLKPGTDQDLLPIFLDEGKISIGFIDLYLPRYFNRDGSTENNTSKFMEDAKKKMGNFFTLDEDNNEK